MASIREVLEAALADVDPDPEDAVPALEDAAQVQGQGDGVRRSKDEAADDGRMDAERGPDEDVHQPDDSAAGNVMAH